MTENKNINSEVSDPTSEEIMNPDSPHFRQDWWQVCEILPPNPWASIVSDLNWSNELLVYARARVAYEVKDVGHYPEATQPTELLKTALSAALQLNEEIVSMVSVKCADLEFAWKWGEYQKAIAIIYGCVPRFENQKGIAISSQNKSDLKYRARQWYSLWLESYKAQKNTKISREMFNPVFSKILEEIRRDVRAIPRGAEEDVLSLIGALLSKKKDEQGRPKLTRHYTENFWGDDFKTTYEEAIENRENFPPYTIDEYPIK